MAKEFLLNWFSKKGIGVRQMIDFGLIICILALLSVTTGFSVIGMTFSIDNFDSMYSLLITLFIFDILYHVGAYYARDKNSGSTNETPTSNDQSKIKSGGTASSSVAPN